MTDLIPAEGFTRDQVDLIKATVAHGASDDELRLFLYTAKRTGLDPLVKQIHFTKRGDRTAMIVGIDGYRLIADRTGLYAGNDEPVYETDDAGNPILARVTVWKLVNGQRCAFSSVARWREYAPEGNQGFMWRKMPFLMLGKVAEALALRKAFPADLSGIYTEDEMAQTDNPEPKRSTVVTVAPQVDPPKQNGGPKPAEGILPAKRTPYVCADCKKPIQGITYKSTGQHVDGAQLAQQSKDDVGRQLCYACWQTAKEQKRVAVTQLPPFADDDVDEPEPVEA